MTASTIKENIQAAKDALPFPSELDQPRWSVVTSDELAASGLSYAEARRLVEQMSGEVSGLCIVTNEAAAKLFGAAKPKTVKAAEKDEDLTQKAFQETL